jgi:hypothetical protein
MRPLRAGGSRSGGVLASSSSLPDSTGHYAVAALLSPAKVDHHVYVQLARLLDGIYFITFQRNKYFNN